ncbi:hypothetical protein [Saccharopolyspora sp. NPDC002686]|uniref:hypothetical protein n=1 Tax=Saccharopolyspora sp. NPDC002686 TaxID=3154541 RepID=UPI003320121F
MARDQVDVIAAGLKVCPVARSNQRRPVPAEEPMHPYRMRELIVVRDECRPVERFA